MNVLKEELKSLVFNKLILLFIIFATVLNGVLIYHQLGAKNGFGFGALQIGAVYEVLPTEPMEAVEYLHRQLDLLTSGDYGSPLLTESLFQEEKLYQEVFQQVSQVANYHEILQTQCLETSAKLKLPFFTTPGTFSYRSLEANKQIYEDLLSQDIKPILSPSLGVNIVLNQRFTDIFLVFFAVILSISLITLQKENGFLALLYPTKCGHGALLTAKFATLWTSLLICVTIVYGTAFLVAEITVGLGDLSRPIQSLDGFLFCQNIISVGQYIFFFLLWKSAWLLIVGSLAFCVCVWTPSGVNSFLVFLAVGLADILRAALPYEWISKTSLIQISNPTWFLSHYYDFNLFSHSVDAKAVVAGWLTFFFLLIIFLAFWGFLRRDVVTHSQSQHIIQKSQSIYISSVFFQEAYKILFQQLALIILAVFFLLQIYTSFSEQYTQDDYEHYYATILAGPITVEKDAFLQNEAQEIDTLHNQLEIYNEKLQDGTISWETYRYLSEEIVTQLRREKGFRKAERQYEHLKKLSRTNLSIQYVEQQVYGLIFGPSALQKNQEMILVLTLVLILGLSNVFAIEESSHMALIISTTPYRELVYRSKFLISAIYSFFATLLILLPRVLIIGRRLGYVGLTASSKSLLFLPTNWPSCSILFFFLFTYTTWLLISMVISFFVLYCSYRLASRSKTILASSLCLILPILIWILLPAQFNIQ